MGTKAKTRDRALRIVSAAMTTAADMQQARAAGSATPFPSTSLYTRNATTQGGAEEREAEGWKTKPLLFK